jgi:hypothetical protein
LNLAHYLLNSHHTNRSSLKSKSKIFLSTFEFKLLSKNFRRSAEKPSRVAVTPLALNPVQDLNWGGGLWHDANKRLDHYIHLQLAPCPANKAWAANNNIRY